MGEAGGGRRPVAGAGVLDHFARVFAMAAGTLAIVVEPWGRGGCQRGHHQARGIVCPHACGFAPHPPGVRPGPSGRDARILETAPGRRCLARGLGQGDPVVMETPRGLARGRRLTEPAGMAREAKDTIRLAVGGKHLADRRGGQRTLPAPQQGGVGRVAAARRDQPAQDPGMVSPRRAGPRTSGGGNEGLRRPCANAAWQRAMVLRGMVRKRARLLALRRLSGVVQSQAKGGGWLSGAGDAVVHPGACEARAVGAVEVGRETCEGRRAGSGVGRIAETPLPPACAHGLLAERSCVLRLRIS